MAEPYMGLLFFSNALYYLCVIVVILYVFMQGDMG